jgi:hypothetical protein
MDNKLIRTIQSEVYKAGGLIGSARLRSESTKYEKDLKSIFDKINKLNNKLVKEINKK